MAQVHSHTCEACQPINKVFFVERVEAYFLAIGQDGPPDVGSSLSKEAKSQAKQAWTGASPF
jgi:hypothetical protein